jgi:hypothetical protein
VLFTVEADTKYCTTVGDGNGTSVGVCAPPTAVTTTAVAPTARIKNIRLMGSSFAPRVPTRPEALVVLCSASLVL